MRKEPAGVDDHVGVEGAQRLRDGGPRLLVGHGALDVGVAEEHGKAAGEMVDVVPMPSGVSDRLAAANSDASPFVMVEP